jgi:mono/diheme cytochrome c family protein
MKLLKLSLLTISLIAVPAQAQDAAASKALFEKVCSACHGLDIITGLTHAKPEWKAIVDTMVGYGAAGSDDELNTIVTYLTTNYGPKSDDAKPADKDAPAKFQSHVPHVR